MREMKKGCELCTKPARMYCDSDQARLCWECDERVHCANFLVAKHFRSLLCHVCQSPTPWKASGAKLGPTVSVCDACSTNSDNNNNKGTAAAAAAAAAAQSSRRHHREDEETTESFVGEDSDDSEDDDDDDDDYSSEEDEAYGEDEEEDGENQVVPWSPSDIPSASAPPLTTSYCSEQESLSTREGGEAVSSSALKRFRHNSRLDSDDEDVCCSSQINSKIAASEEENGGSSYRAMELKMSRREECSSRATTTGETESRRKFRKIEIMRSLLTFQQRMACSDHNASAAEIIRGISKLSRDV